MKFKKQNRFAEAYNDFYPLIFSAVFTKINHADDAADICQEVFFKLYQKIEEVRDCRKWLYGTLRNEVFAYYRKKKGDQVDIDEVFNDVGLTFVNAFRDLRIIIAEAIESSGNYKDEKEQALFELIAVHNFTYEAAGKQLGLNKRQVRYRYNLILERITDYLKKKGINSLEELL